LNGDSTVIVKDHHQKWRTWLIYFK